ncbi:MAG: transposase [Rubrobacter sp.]|nr:transposase [Rubrobacter sp.]
MVERELRLAAHAKLVFCEQSIERSFSWTGQNRRLSKDYERVPETGEALMYVAMTRLMVRRLARS